MTLRLPILKASEFTIPDYISQKYVGLVKIEACYQQQSRRTLWLWLFFLLSSTRGWWTLLWGLKHCIKFMLLEIWSVCTHNLHIISYKQCPKKEWWWIRNQIWEEVELDGRLHAKMNLRLVLWSNLVYVLRGSPDLQRAKSERSLIWADTQTF